MFETKIVYIGGECENVNIGITDEGQVKKALLPVKGLCAEKIDYIDILVNDGKIQAGDEGFFLFPGSRKLVDAAIGSFKEHADAYIDCAFPRMTLMGINHGGGAYIAFATGMKEVAWHHLDIKDGEYKFYMRYVLHGEELYEDVAMEVHYLKDDLSYSAMAREYRKYLLADGFKSIKERLHPALSYAAETMYVRIRQGWKPVPCKVFEQTEETEPPMHVACTFADVERIMRSYKKAGIDKAEFCLVGFNKSGHDGRWPQILPVDERLGGYEGLKKVMETAKELGYTVCCHTNSTEGYTIANNMKESDIARRKDGSLDILGERWSGGRSYNICPKRGYEIAMETLPELVKLGFSGTHYIDVITATPARNCYSPEHRVNYKEGVEYYDKLFIKARELFGCIGCECSYINNYKYVDYTLYDSFRQSFDNMRQEKEPDIIDEFVPLTQLVFHGIVLSNPQSSAVNAALNKNPAAMLKCIEYGGRPSLYYYSRFVTDGTDWIGGEDFKCGTEEELEISTAAAKKTYDIYNELSYLQYEFMESHEKTADKVYRITYSDGSVITVDYNKNTYKLDKKA